jgi:hypothetical protein
MFTCNLHICLIMLHYFLTQNFQRTNAYKHVSGTLLSKSLNRNIYRLHSTLSETEHTSAKSTNEKSLTFTQFSNLGLLSEIVQGLAVQG